MVLVDSHCHLISNNLELPPKDLATILKNNKRMDVGYMLAMSTCMSCLQANIDLASVYDNIFCSVGIHPSHAREHIDLNLISELLTHKKVVAIGEVGLDYFYSDPDKNEQQELLHKMLSLSKKVNLPYVFHARDCFPDILDIISDYENIEGVFHCYTDGVENAKKILNRGFYISISGIITFKNSGDLRKVLQYIPDDRLLIETDSPYLSPIPFRGQINEPSYVRLVAEKIAEEKKMELEKLAKITTRNFFTLFNQALLSGTVANKEEVL